MKESVQRKQVAWPKIMVWGALAAMVLAAAGITLAKKTRRMEDVVLATATQPIGAVVCVALEKGYFEQEGLRIVTQPYASGKDALQAVMDGKAEVCEVAETPVVLAVLQGKPARIFASVAWSQKNMALVGRSDRGIRDPADLRGKKIGVTMRTNGEFFLHQFLTSRGIARSDVQVENIAPTGMVARLTEGTVDAVATWNPHVAKLQKRLGTNAVVYHDVSYVWTWNMATKTAYLDARPRTVQKILRAVLRAGEFVQANPAEAQAIVAARTEMDPAILAEIWGVFSFGVGIENMLLGSLNSQAAWAIESGLSDAKERPDFRKVIHTKALRELKPEAVLLRD